MIKVNNFDKALALANKIADDLNKEENVATYTVQVEKWAKEVWIIKKYKDVIEIIQY